MKIIFLDIDGVLNNATTHDSKHMKTWPDWPFVGLDKRLVPLLNRLVKATGAWVVLSSTWRKSHTAFQMEERLISAGMDNTVRLVGTTPVFGGKRRAEIASWIVEHPKLVDKFVIIDDDSDADIEGHFVNTDGTVGLTEQDVDDAIKILGGKDAT